ncbi:ABC transporter permease [Actinoplanes ianthinogenes]|uniref:ABC transporter permease n=1 Tax=Actinoplanes ianthinogenes TaxID=122358 RepID=UPI00166FEFB2|nr:ABC transporter permease [Actinoplanes ianthinogenes]GGR12948.1 ABC transporter permease [Actinoplanes ianthinogenes]
MFVAWRDLRFAKGRFALMGAVIVLITLLVGLLSGLTAGLGQQNISAIAGLPADKITFSHQISYADSTVTTEQWRRWSQVPGVISAEPVGISTTKATAGSRSVTVSAFGVRPGSTLTRVDPGQVVLSVTAATDLGVTSGDVLTLGDQERVVAAIRGDESFSHLPVVWTTLAGEPTVLALRTDGADIATADRAIGTHTVSRDESYAAIGSYRSENGSLQLMRGFLFVIAALVIGAFFTVWTIQRSLDIAVLKALGASTAALLRDALGQAAVLLLTGTLTGAVLAAAIGAAVAGTVPFQLTPATLMLPAAVMTVLGMLGAALSVRRITTVDPLTALGSAR